MLSWSLTVIMDKDYGHTAVHWQLNTKLHLSYFQGKHVSDGPALRLTQGKCHVEKEPLHSVPYNFYLYIQAMRESQEIKRELTSVKPLTLMV